MSAISRCHPRRVVPRKIRQAVIHYDTLPCTGSSTIGGKRSSMDANVADRELPRKWVIDKQKSQNLLQEMLCVYQYADESGQLSFPFHDIFSASSGLS